MMKLRALLEHEVLRGAVAFMPWDSVKDLPAEVDCTVAAVSRDGQRLQGAVPHTSGLHGFLHLRKGDYQIRIAAASPAFLPSLRSVTVPLPENASVIMTAPLLPSASYPAPAGSLVLRGTVHWQRALPTPARWAAVFARLEGLKAGTWRPVHATWTRTDGKGEFALFLRAAPPGAEGTRDPLRAVVEIHASAPPAYPLDEDALQDLVLDDGKEEDVRKRQPLARTVIVKNDELRPGATLSLNQDEYTTQPAGSTRQKHTVILLS